MDQDELENVILTMWKGVLKVDDVSTTDPFLSQGATSLNFVQFSSNLERVLGIEIGPEDVFRHGDVERLARLVRERRAAANA